MNRLDKTIIISLAVLSALVISACKHAGTPLPEAPAIVTEQNKIQEPAPPVAREPEKINSPSEKELIERGVVALEGGVELVPDYEESSRILGQLLETYPHSKWRRVAETLLLLLDDIRSGQQILNKSDAENKKLMRENDRLKREIRTLNEQLQATLKESEELKKGMERLKNIEIELEKRNQLLR